jgi:UDP-glucose 4-epimerase
LKSRGLVFGGKGFIGSHLVAKLLSRGFAVRVFDRAILPTSLDPILCKEVEWFDGDFTRETDVEASLKGCDYCFHLVSTTLPKTSNQDPVYDVYTNVVSSVRMLEKARDSNIRKVIFVSSGGTVYGIPKYLPIDENHPTNPICSYGIGKLAVEKFLGLFYHLYGLDYAVLRLSNPYGKNQRPDSNQGAVAVFLQKALRNETIEIWGDGAIVRDYIHISDVVDATISAMDYQGNEHVFNIGSGIPTSLLDLLDHIEKIIGKTIAKLFMESRSFDVPKNVLNIERAKKELRWSPSVPLSTGLAMTANDYRLKNEKMVDEKNFRKNIS